MAHAKVFGGRNQWATTYRSVNRIINYRLCVPVGNSDKKRAWIQKQKFLIMKLMKSFYQMDNKEPWQLESQLDIKVEYDEDEDVVTEVLRVSSYNHKNRRFTDMTRFFTEQLEEALEAMIMGTNWREVYDEKRLEMIDYGSELEPADNE